MGSFTIARPLSLSLSKLVEPALQWDAANVAGLGVVMRVKFRSFLQHQHHQLTILRDREVQVCPLWITGNRSAGTLQTWKHRYYYFTSWAEEKCLNNTMQDDNIYLSISAHDHLINE